MPMKNLSPLPITSWNIWATMFDIVDSRARSSPLLPNTPVSPRVIGSVAVPITCLPISFDLAMASSTIALASATRGYFATRSATGVVVTGSTVLVEPQVAPVVASSFKDTRPTFEA